MTVRPHLLPHALLLSLLLALFASCTPPEQGLELRSWRILSGGSGPVDEGQRVESGNSVDVPGHGAMPVWLGCEVPVDPDTGDLWLYIRRLPFAWELWVNGTMAGKDGSVDAPAYIPFESSSIIPVSQSLLRGRNMADIRIRVLPDTKPFTLPVIYLLDNETGQGLARNVIPLNREAYRSVVVICFVLAMYFFIHFLFRPRNPSPILAAFFNLFMGLYLFGLSQSWSGMGLPMVGAFSFFKATLFPGLAFLGLYLYSLHSRLPFRLAISIISASLIQGALQSLLPATLAGALQVFSVLLIPSALWLIVQCIRLARLPRKDPVVWIMIAGGAIATGMASHDVLCLLVDNPPRLWHQGIGTFILQATIFMSLAARNALDQTIIEDIAADVGQQVHTKTAELEQVNRELKEANRAKTDFLAQMSHEIRTPLNSIMGFSQILEDHESDPLRKQQIGTILRESRTLLDLINQVLDHSRLEGHKLRLDNQDFSLDDLLDHGVDIMAPMAERKNLALVLAKEDHMPSLCHGDPLRLQQILQNLLGNAVKFTLGGTVRLWADGHREDDKEWVDIRVEDTGIGIPAAHLDRIFGSFEQGDSSITRRFGGSGLGLSIVKELVDLMEGHIRVESTEGRGTTVFLSLPIGATPSCPPAKTYLAGPGTPSARPRFRPDTTIAVVEDYEPNTQLVRLFLEPLGARLVCLSDGVTALDWLESHKPSLMLLDIHMPGKDGYEVARCIRRDHRTLESMPIIALTADAWGDVRERCLQAGMDEVLTKPLVLDSMLATLKDTCPDLFITTRENPPEPPPASQANPRPDPVTMDAGLPDPAMDAAPPACGSNRSTLAYHFGICEEDVDQLVQGFLLSGGNLVADMESALSIQDVPSFCTKARALGSGARNIQAHTLAERSFQALQNAEEGYANRLPEDMQAIRRAWDACKSSWKACLTLPKDDGTGIIQP